MFHAGRGMFYSDVGNSLLAVDEATSQISGLHFRHPCIQVSLISMPSTGLVVASIALSTAPLQKSEEERQVRSRSPGFERSWSVFGVLGAGSPFASAHSRARAEDGDCSVSWAFRGHAGIHLVGCCALVWWRPCWSMNELAMTISIF